MKKLLIVVDMQNDFITDALGTSEAQAIVPAVTAHIRNLRAEGYQMIATLDTHGEDYMLTPEAAKLPVPHCIKGTEGWQLNPAVAAALGDFLPVEKPMASAATIYSCSRRLRIWPLTRRAVPVQEIKVK